jgi:hypothetical protein
VGGRDCAVGVREGEAAFSCRRPALALSFSLSPERFPERFSPIIAAGFLLSSLYRVLLPFFYAGRRRALPAPRSFEKQTKNEPNKSI